jgi:hypothetical protein
LTTYIQNPPTFSAALWDGVNKGPVDVMLTDLYGADYLGSEVDGDTLTVAGQESLWFLGHNPSLTIPAGNVLIRGPFYGAYVAEARWEFITPEAFADRFSVKT